MKVLKGLFTEKEIVGLKDFGLLDPTRFEFKKPINHSIARQLIAIPSLRVIQFHESIPDKFSLKVFNEIAFKTRKDLTLRVYGYQDTWRDISLLYELPEVERFDWDSDVIGSLQPLYSVKKLTHLGLGLIQPKPKVSLSFVADFSDTIQSLSIAGDFRDLTSTIPKLNYLTRIWFASTKLDGFDFLENLSIETLGNYGGRVRSFEFIRKLQTLRKIHIKTNPTLKSIDFIEHLPQLEWIEFLYLSKIVTFPRCDHLKNLKGVLAYECNRLSDISELKKLEGIKVSVSGKALKGRHYRTENFSFADFFSVQ